MPAAASSIRFLAFPPTSDNAELSFSVNVRINSVSTGSPSHKAWRSVRKEESRLSYRPSKGTYKTRKITAFIKGRVITPQLLKNEELTAAASTKCVKKIE